MFRRFLALVATVSLVAVAMYVDPAGAAKPDPRITSLETSFNTSTCIITATAHVADLKGPNWFATFASYEGSTFSHGGQTTAPRGATSVVGLMGVPSGHTVTRVTAQLHNPRFSGPVVERTGLSYTCA